jgi:D-alanyl-D-alanine carboxypeptidase/D-alanyl-D-alanine-endopeptidase (penicillin-binding protein 4)
VEIAPAGVHPDVVPTWFTKRVKRWPAASAMAVALCAVPAAPSSAEPPLQAQARAVGAKQGVYAIAEDGSVLAAWNESLPVHPASVSKVATTLALLDRLGPDHRFETRFAAADAGDHGISPGDLVVEAGGDPFFVSESALLVAAELRRNGLGAFRGKVRVRGAWLFNWESDATGSRLTKVLSGQEAGDAWGRLTILRPELSALSARPATLRFANGSSVAGVPARVVATYRSPSLRAIMKALNCYSNNVFHPLSQVVGGPKVVEQITRERLPQSERDELRIDNAAGAGTTNRMSARAAVSLLLALEREAAEHRLTLADLLPVAGIDEGTLRDRVLPDEPAGALVGKTGTYGSLGASALAGIVRTKRYGVVVFAVLNKGLPVPEARVRQDAFVHAIMTQGEATAFAYSLPPSPLTEIELARTASAQSGNTSTTSRP